MPIKIALELSEATPKEIDALVCFLTVCGGGLKEEHSAPPAVAENQPEAAFTLTSPEPAKTTEPVQKWGPSLVPPPPPPAASNPSSPSPVTPASNLTGPGVSVAAPTTDKSGLPWDERIHASTRALTADGLWRKKRGVDETTVTAVETQLRQVMSIPAPAAVAPPPPPPAAVSGPSFQDKFVALIGRTAQALAAGKISQAQIQQCADSAGLPNIQMLFNRPDLFDQVAFAVNAIIGE